MNEGTVRLQAQMYAAVARLEQMISMRQGMVAENEQRASLGQAQAYGNRAFESIADEMAAVSNELRNLAKEPSNRRNNQVQSFWD